MENFEKKYEVIDDFLFFHDATSIENNLLGDWSFPWFLVNGVLSEDYDTKNNFQFVHNFMDDSQRTSPYFSYAYALLDKLNAKKVYRVKANLNTATESVFEHGYHVDYPNLNIKTAVYYVNSNNGYTKFKTGEKIESVKNRILIFDSQMEHTGSTCTDKNYRCVININYED